MTLLDQVMWMTGWWFWISVVVGLIISIISTNLKRGKS